MNKDLLTISTSEYRPCLVNNKKAFFHKWIEQPFICKDGSISRTRGLVEYEDGSIDEVYPTTIKFIDNPGFDEYAFDEALKEARPSKKATEVSLD